jgi:hypothetical protein
MYISNNKEEIDLMMHIIEIPQSDSIVCITILLGFRIVLK